MTLKLRYYMKNKGGGPNFWRVLYIYVRIFLFFTKSPLIYVWIQVSKTVHRVHGKMRHPLNESKPNQNTFAYLIKGRYLISFKYAPRKYSPSFHMSLHVFEFGNFLCAANVSCNLNFFLFFFLALFWTGKSQRIVCISESKLRHEKISQCDFVGEISGNLILTANPNC